MSDRGRQLLHEFISENGCFAAGSRH